MASLSHSVYRELSVSIDRAFAVVVAEDVLPKVLRRWGPIPAVIGTRDLTGPWNEPGSQRTVLLEDGNSARERVLVWQRPWQFEYRVDQITGPLGRLVDHASGRWDFVATEQGSRFRWTYAFRPRSRVATPALTVLAKTAWARYMNQCADLCVELASGEA